MSDLDAIVNDFKRKVCAEIRLQSEGVNRFRVFTPFMLDDGDHLSVVLRQDRQNWVLTDEGHTYMHLTYDIEEKDLQRGTRQKIISNALDAFSVADLEGELMLRIADERYGDALFSFVQALLRISDVTLLSRERVRSTFMEDFKAFLSEKVSPDRRTFDWHDPIQDPEAKYAVDCKVNGMAKPILIFALPTDDKTRDSTIAMLNFERWGHNFNTLGIFEDQEQIHRKVLARFSDVCAKQFSSLGANRDRIAKYLQETMQ